MFVTSRSKRWELLHSLWIGWTFTLGFFNWIAFFYIAFRARQKKWAVWGAIYTVPFILAMIFAGGDAFSGWIGDLIIASILMLGVVSIVHAFWIRKEYLLRLDHRKQQARQDDTLLKQRLATEYESQLKKEKSVAPKSHGSLQTASESEPKKVSNKEGQSLVQSESKPVRRESYDDVMLEKPAFPPNILENDDLEYRITSSYPFPLAFGFRTLASIVDSRDLYREQLRVVENMLAYLGSISLAILLPQDYAKAKIDPKDYWLTGISTGDWKEIVARSSGVFGEYKDDPLAMSIKSLNIRSEKKQLSFGNSVAALIRAKNDYKHDRGPFVLEDIAAASRETQEKLRTCLEALAFSIDYPIRQVEDFDVARRGGGVILKCLRYTGDHPSFPQEEIPYERALPRGDLFLDQGHYEWTPLFPFITTMTCSHCKVRETYFIDAWDTRKGVARMKSFERGHTMISMEVSKALEEYSNSVRRSIS